MFSLDNQNKSSNLSKKTQKSTIIAEENMNSHPSLAEENALVSENELVINLVKLSTPAQKQHAKRF